MASNEIPRVYTPLVQLLTDAAEGVAQHGASLTLDPADGPALEAALTALVGAPAGPGGAPPALPGLKARVNSAKADKTLAGAARRTAISNGRALAMGCVATLKSRLGNSWSGSWQEAGFQGGSLVTPENPQVLLLELRAYYAANPTHEVPNLSLTLAATAAACQAGADAIAAAAAEVNASETQLGQALKDLEAGMVTARRRLTKLRQDLERVLGAQDERWYLFGFERPADPETPEVPVDLVATPGPPRQRRLFLAWADARRAESYRVRLGNVATGSGQAAERIVEESEALFPSLPAGLVVDVTVSARNAAGGESAPSAPARVAVP